MVGSDADLVIVDFNLKMKVTSENLRKKCGRSSYEGFELKALPVLTMVRGSSFPTPTCSEYMKPFSTH